MLKTEALGLETLKTEALGLEMLEAEALERDSLEREVQEPETLEWRGARRLGQTRPHDAPLSPAPTALPIQADEGPTPSGVRPSLRVPPLIFPRDWTSPPSSPEN